MSNSDTSENLDPQFDPQTSHSLFVVGDDAQSIYGFRGSKVEIILEDFANYYQGSKEIILNQNYRSTAAILSLAEQVLTHNPKQKKKQLFTTKDSQTQVFYYLAKNERDEVEYIIRQLHQLYSGQKGQKNPTKEAENKLQAQESEEEKILTQILEKLKASNLEEKLG